MGKIDDALARTAGQRVYFDTNAFVYFLDRHPEYFDLVAPFIEAAANGTLLGVTGDAAVAETLVKPYQLDNLPLVASIKAFFHAKDFLSILPHDGETFDLAAQFRARLGMKFIDALHYATAVRAGCKFLLTNDAGIRSTPALEVLSIKELASP
jgi:predicted nucleic acid-binding protein